MKKNHEVMNVSARIPKSIMDDFLAAAEAVGSIDRQGRNAGKASIGAMIHDIACGRIVLSFGVDKQLRK